MRSPESGYSLVEMGVVCAVMFILAAMAVPLFDSATTRSNADAAAQLIAQELRYARALALGSHANVAVQFSPASNEVAVAPGTGSVRGPFVLPLRMRLQPAALGPATPDNLNATVLGTGGYTQMTFLDNGSVVDDPVANNLISGTFFLQHANGDASTRRAVTLVGGTGRVHIWRYDCATNSWR